VAEENWESLKGQKQHRDVNTPTPFWAHTHLRSIQADDSIYIPGTVEEVGDRDSVFTCGNPVLLGVWVDLEDVGPCTEDGLLSAGREREEEEREEKGRRDGTVSVWFYCRL